MLNFLNFFFYTFNIVGEEYEILSCLPETVIYTCTPCTFEHTPAWRSSIGEYRSAGLKVIINALLYSKCARYLFKKVKYENTILCCNIMCIVNAIYIH